MKIRALVHPEKKQIACALIQAIYGGDRTVIHYFDNWLLSPVEGMKWALLTDEDWQKLAKKWNAK